MMKIQLSSASFIYLILISIAVSPAFALGTGGINLLLIGVMCISPLILLTYRKMYQSDIWLFLFIISIILSPLANNPESMRWSTVLFTIMFVLTFLAYERLLDVSMFSIENYLIILKYLIYAYVIVLLIQQFCVLTGLPIFNVSNYRINEPWKLNSLTSEPSHSARIVALLMYSYISIKEIIMERPYNLHLDFKYDKKIWIAFLWTMITMGSGTAFLFITIVLLKFMRLKSLIPLFIILIIAIVITSFMNIEAFERTFSLFLATLTLDPTAIWKADPSGAFRILPFLTLAELVNITTINGWFGHGIDSVSTFLSIYVVGLPEGATGGGLLQLWYDYGFMSFLLFIIFNFLKVLDKNDYLSIVFWIMLILIQGINNQILWLCIILLFTNKYFRKIKRGY